MMMMMCNDLMCTRKLTRSQLSLAHGARVKTRHAREKRETAKVCALRPLGGKVEELWRRGFVEKMSFESGVEVRSNRW